MDEETSHCQKLVKAMFIGNIKDMVLPLGELNSRKSCKAAFNFMLNEDSSEYQDFCFWCDTAELNKEYWQQMALMNLAYELNFKPWLRRRIFLNMRGQKNWLRLKKYYCDCHEIKYHNFLGAIENANID